jgi:hypothetical protein
MATTTAHKEQAMTTMTKYTLNIGITLIGDQHTYMREAIKNTMLGTYIVDHAIDDAIANSDTDSYDVYLPIEIWHRVAELVALYAMKQPRPDRIGMFNLACHLHDNA